MHADYNVDCKSDEYMWIETAGIIFCILWPFGAPIFLGGLLYFYNIPTIAKRKVRKAEQKALLRSFYHFPAL